MAPDLLFGRRGQKRLKVWPLTMDG